MEQTTLEFSLTEPVIEVEDIGSSSLMEKPFDPKQIDISQKTLSIDLLIKRLAANPKEIDLYPDFQRKDDLWSELKQSQLIESILISFPLPAFYFDGTNNNKWLVVDGLQRLSALRKFIIDKNLRLTGLEFLSQLEGSSYDELSRTIQRKIEETQIVAYIINPGTPDEVKFNIFKRINTTPLALTSQEIRHAINQPLPAKYVAELASANEFKEATENMINPDRMVDREFVTRFISFYMNPASEYKRDLDAFMNQSMAQIKNLSEEERAKMKSDFLQSMKLSKKIFGKWAFRKVFNIEEKRKPINKALFEVWSVSLARLNRTQKHLVEEYSENIFNDFIVLMNKDEKFIDAITASTGDKSKVAYRFAAIANLIQNAIQV